MKFSKFLVFFIFVSHLVFSQSTIKGKILQSESNQAVWGATIYLPDLKIGTVTDSNGYFELDNLPKGNIIAQISAVGFSNIITNFLAPSDANILKLAHSVTELQSMVVTGMSSTTEMRRSPVPIVAISPKYLAQNTATNVIDAISKIPGLSTLSSGPNISKPFIRGLGYNRVLTLFDGIRQDGQQWGDEHGVEIDQNLIEKIEIIKGPASLMYGSDALAGVINLLPAEKPNVDKIIGEYASNFQTNNLMIGNTLALASAKNGFSWGFRASHKQAADYKNKWDGRVFGTKFNETALNANMGLYKKWGYSYINASIYKNLQEVPSGNRDSTTRKFTRQISESEDDFMPIVPDNELKSYKIENIHQNIQHFRIYSANNYIFNNSRIMINLGYQQSKRREFSHPKNPEIPGLFLTLNNFTYDFKYFIPEFSGYNSVVGFNGMYQNNANKSATEFVIPDYKSFDIGGFVHSKKSYNKLDISAGLRYDFRNINTEAMYVKTNSENGFTTQVSYNQNDKSISQQFENYSALLSGLSGSVGATYNFNKKFCMKANVARGYRAPNISELSAKGIHPGTGYLQLGNDNFKPEFSNQIDLGLFYYDQHVSFSAEIFYNRLSNYIFNQKLSTISGQDSVYNQNGNLYPIFKYQQTQAGLFGGEVSLDVHLVDWLHFQNSVSLLSAQNLGGNNVVLTENNKYLPFIIPAHTNHELRAEFEKLGNNKLIGAWFVKFGVQYFAAQNRIYAENNTETNTPKYTLIDAGMGFDILNKKGKKIMNFAILGTNMADIAYQSNMSRLKYMDNYPNNWTGRSGIYNMGRNISFKLTFHLDSRI